jgi:hypothetical protein
MVNGRPEEMGDAGCTPVLGPERVDDLADR